MLALSIGHKSQVTSHKLKKNRITLKEAVKFHGHLGPYLVLGLLAGELALKELACKKYFGIGVSVWGADKKPKSCLIDGLQLSTGATFGKGNIKKKAGPNIKIEFFREQGRKRICLIINDGLIQELEKTKSHEAAELLAKRLYRLPAFRIFKFK